VGSLAVAFQPLLGFIGSGVNPDSLGFLTAAVTFLAIARGFRRGLDVPTALAIGGSVAAGALTKPLFLGLAPAALLAIVLLARRPGPDGGSRPLRAAGLAVLTAALPVLAFAILGPLVWDHGLFGANGVGDVLRSGSAEPGAGTATNLREELSYIWQLFLPALPFMHDVFPGTPLWWVWFKGFVGQFGYLDYGFPSWADTVAAVALIGVGLAAAAVLVRRRTALAARLPELACYAVATIGICGVIGVADWHAALGHDDLFHQARYLMPLLALYAAIVGLCIGVAGRRTRAVAAVAIVGVAAVHSLAAFVLTLDRYYG
jgi:hypothetical protein